MTLKDFIILLEQVAGSQPAVRTVIRNDIYRLNHLPNVRYGVFAWQQEEHRISEDAMVLSFTLVYADRLDLTELAGQPAVQGNELDIQSTAVQVLANVVKILRDGGIHVDDYGVTVFSQRFSDECAGAFARVGFRVPLNEYCGYEIGAFNIDFNNDFDIL
jgi:hypothetical protein